MTVVGWYEGEFGKNGGHCAVGEEARGTMDNLGIEALCIGLEKIDLIKSMAGGKGIECLDVDGFALAALMRGDRSQSVELGVVCVDEMSESRSVP